MFVFILTLQSTLFEIPFSLYSAFVIEEKHGFNKQTLKLFFADIFKTLILTFVIGSPVVSGIVSLARLGGPHYYVYVWAFLFCFQLFLMTVYPEWIAPLFNKFSPLDPETHGDLKKEIEALATRVNFPLTKLFVVDGSIRSGHSNAYVSFSTMILA
jgi:STE24 endopeptidase